MSIRWGGRGCDWNVCIEEWSTVIEISRWDACSSVVWRDGKWLHWYNHLIVKMIITAKILLCCANSKGVEQAHAGMVNDLYCGFNSLVIMRIIDTGQNNKFRFEPSAGRPLIAAPTLNDARLAVKTHCVMLCYFLRKCASCKLDGFV